MEGIVFSATHNSIDVVNSMFFIAAFFYSMYYLKEYYLKENHITIQGKIKYVFIITVSVLYVFQTVTQLLTNTVASFLVWDIINYLNAIFILMVAHRISKRENVDLK